MWWSVVIFWRPRLQRKLWVKTKIGKKLSAVNSQGKGNYIDSGLVKDKEKTRPSEATDDIKKRVKQVSKIQTQCINFKDSLQDHNSGLVLILTGLKISLWQGIIIVSKGYTVNVLQVKPIRIGWHLCSNCLCKKNKSSLIEVICPYRDLSETLPKQFLFL